MAAPKEQDVDDLEKNLVKTVLELEEIDKDLYRGSNLWKPFYSRGVFGGQIIGQALVAAGKSKADHLHAHSLHCYFIGAGDPNRPFLYHVEKLRDGGSFCTRSVKAVQNGVPVLTMQVSYHKNEEGPLNHQYAMPDAPNPESLLSVDELFERFLHHKKISESQKEYIEKYLVQEIPVEIKPVNPLTFMRLRPSPPRKSLKWIRAKGHISANNMNLHRCMAAYMCDYTLLRTTLLADPKYEPGMMASLDHSMWFHAPFKANEWMLYESESPQAGGNRALALGRLWRQDGTLAVSAAQEGLIRPKDSSKKSQFKSVL